MRRVGEWAVPPRPWLGAAARGALLAMLACAGRPAVAAPERPPDLGARILAAAERADRNVGGRERYLARNRPYRECLVQILLASDLPTERLERVVRETEAGRDDPLRAERPDLFDAATARCPQGGLPR